MYIFPMRGDTVLVRKVLHAVEISIHSPYAGDTSTAFISFVHRLRFQSILPVRGDTSTRSSLRPRSDFNPPSPCGEIPLGRTSSPESHFNPLSP